MALVTDGLINTSDALQKYENGILNVASTEAIDITAKALIAQDEILTALQVFLERSTVRDAAVLTCRHISCGQIVVTNPLKRWHAYKTLAMIYRDAYNNQLNDRYQGKRQEYEQLAADTEQTFYKAGAGIVHNPTPRATVPTLTIIPVDVSGTSYYLRVTWINAFNQEGSASDPLQAATSDGSAAVVASLQAPAGIDSWNVYAGTGPDEVQLQNTMPIAIGGTWILPPGGLVTGRGPGDGQLPEWWIVDRHILQRG